MAKIILDIFLIIFFIAVAGLQVYVILRIRELKNTYTEFMQSQNRFIGAIEKAKQSLMIVNSQAVDILPELKKSIEESNNLMQDFSFVLARANKKIDTLQSLSNIENQTVNNNAVNSNTNKSSVPLSGNYNMSNTYQQSYNQANQENEYYNQGQTTDPLLARLEQLEQQEKTEELNEDFLKADSSSKNYQQDLIDKALKEIL